VAVSVTKGFDAEYLKKEIARQEAARQREAGREARREAGQPGAAARYYTAAAGKWEPPGRWVGTAAPRLGLTGDVKADVLDQVFVGQRAPDVSG
jgi:TrwC relaxase